MLPVPGEASMYQLESASAPETSQATPAPERWGRQPASLPAAPVEVLAEFEVKVTLHSLPKRVDQVLLVSEPRYRVDEVYKLLRLFDGGALD